jgi:aspartate racemase
MLKGITTLRQGGATAIAIACNTAHHWFDDLERLGELPIIHIADAACAELARLKNIASLSADETAPRPSKEEFAKINQSLQEL